MTWQEEYHRSLKLEAGWQEELLFWETLEQK